jgi:hypothetical protein
MLCAACAHNPDKFSTLEGVTGNGGGACSAFPRPQYQVKGQTVFDQRWADETTEAGVAGCGWKRPQARPASLMPVKPSPVLPSPKATFKRRWLGKFFHDRVS